MVGGVLIYIDIEDGQSSLSHRSNTHLVVLSKLKFMIDVTSRGRSRDSNFTTIREITMMLMIKVFVAKLRSEKWA